MPKRVIEAVSLDGLTPPLYFLGYRDKGLRAECVWTPNRARARWFDADEAAVEVELIAPMVEPQRILTVQPIMA
ncbi:hypothetical protein [Paracraurococcus ruber]|uniref:Uncharacterized protein n=1 Tax=Paracraurococcus ruber TaxID=77675 RepID=A0ABS1D0N6_9PROT|nr:hypothetical protein [Paracraurococcus ruber]MBK1660155.1 hypothetical protein [Paracraurococcus ruber]TDG26937.1 hypothetical protein E2C05_24550 [Paracraurococcus ruber]